VTVVNARQQLRYYQVDVLDKSVRELNVL
jgi:hypothetical protein